MAPLNSRSASRSWRRGLMSEAAPTSAAASGPSRTTAASVAAELGDHFVCREVSGVLAELQIRNKTCRTIRANNGWGICIFCCMNVAKATSAPVIATTSTMYSHAARETMP